MWILDSLKEKNLCNDIAVIYGDELTTYKTLWEKSEVLAYYLENSIKIKNPIVIYGNKETDIIVVMLAALKNGIPYVPVDTSYPLDRLYKICDQVKPSIIFNFSEKIVDYCNLVIDKQKINIIYDKYVGQKSNENKWCQENDVCYILFTSGSTGEPKGVPITKKNICTFTSWFSKYCSSNGENSVVLNQVVYSFDVSVIPLYIFLSMGATLLSVDRLMLKDFNKLFNYLSSHNITDWVSTPSLVDLFCYESRFSRETFKYLNKFILAGELLKNIQVRNIRNLYGENCTVINGYGPTEATVLVSAEIVDFNTIDNELIVPIGTINENMRYVINNSIISIDGSKTGELYIIGDSVCDGYYKNPIQTKYKFFKDEYGKKGYKTGDIVFEKNGKLYFLERKDNQIKLNGYRIELEDISNNCLNIKYIQNCVVMPKIVNNEVVHLVAFIKIDRCLEKSKGLNLNIKIKKDIKKYLPEYMIPKKIIIMDDFPLNVNGKIDRKKLLEFM